MRHVLLILLLAVVSAQGSARDPSNYFYRISPADAPLKKEPAYKAKRSEYPADARRDHLTGSGLFALHIAADGHVVRVEALKSIGHPSLDQAAIAAFRQWRFRPGSIQVVRVPIRYIDSPHVPDALDRRPLKEYGDGVQITVASK
jgi:TonB family protein